MSTDCVGIYMKNERVNECERGYINSRRTGNINVYSSHSHRPSSSTTPGLRYILQNSRTPYRYKQDITVLHLFHSNTTHLMTFITVLHFPCSLLIWSNHCNRESKSTPKNFNVSTLSNCFPYIHNFILSSIIFLVKKTV